MGCQRAQTSCLLTNITRHEWGFNGYIVSDQGAIGNIISHLKTAVETSAACIKAGCTMELGTRLFDKQLNAMRQGLLTEEQLRYNVRRMMYTRLRLGEFDPEEMNPYNAVNMSIVQSPVHRELAVIAAVKSFVLLKSLDGLLPLMKTYSILAVKKIVGSVYFVFFAR